ncbi:hypothetical protein DPEC_G00287320 [Dallia pectoralis]|uniref:Uncharacterized protein n=1 Tax=Dallia pectoralis TaxID=75939 RepID=A0ACC2FKH1_DALPE|nr:hypothetical protein DPEC_G00287320 [Dallia pectoralis]
MLGWELRIMEIRRADDVMMRGNSATKERASPPVIGSACRMGSASSSVKTIKRHLDTRATSQTPSYCAVVDRSVRPGLRWSRGFAVHSVGDRVQFRTALSMFLGSQAFQSAAESTVFLSQIC